jgi:hypothetical protein
LDSQRSTASAASLDEASGRLTFTGTASLGAYQTLLRSVTFSSSSSTLPNTGSRTIGIQVLDANSDGLTPHWSTVATAALDVLGVNQAPLLSSATGVDSYTENDSETQANAQFTLSDGDSSAAFRRHRHHQRRSDAGGSPCAAGVRG